MSNPKQNGFLALHGYMFFFPIYVIANIFRGTSAQTIYEATKEVWGGMLESAPFWKITLAFGLASWSWMLGTVFLVRWLFGG